MQTTVAQDAKTAISERARKSTRSSLLAIAVLALVIFAIPVFVGDSPYLMQEAVTTLFFAALAQSLNLVMGFAGVVSFAQAAFYGIGAYTSALIALHFGVGFWGGFVAALLMTFTLAIVLGLPTLRLGGPYLAIATIGLQVIIQSVLLRWTSLTNGPAGINNIVAPTLFGIQIRQGVSYYLMVAVWLLAIIVLLYRISRTRLGYELLATREAEGAALAIGVPVSRLRIAIFALSAALAGGTGSLYAHYIGSIDPYVFDLTLSATVLVMVLLGGRASIIGVTIGAAILTLLPEYLQAVSNYRMVLYGAGMVILTLFFPKGLAGLAILRRSIGRGTRTEPGGGVAGVDA